MSIAAPIIETERFRLRGHRYNDFSDCVAMWSDPIVTKYIGGKPSTPTQTWARLSSYVGHWALLGFGYWVIEAKDTQQFVGEIGLADFKRDIIAEMKTDPEIGFALVPAFHGKGVATECAHAVIAWADTNLPSGRTVCLINPENVGSRNVVDKIGYREFARGTLNDTAVLFLERLRAG